MRNRVFALVIIVIVLISFSLGMLVSCGEKICLNCERYPVTDSCNRDRCKNCCRSSAVCSEAGCES